MPEEARKREEERNISRHGFGRFDDSGSVSVRTAPVPDPDAPGRLPPRRRFSAGRPRPQQAAAAPVPEQDSSHTRVSVRCIDRELPEGCRSFPFAPEREETPAQNAQEALRTASSKPAETSRSDSVKSPEDPSGAPAGSVPAGEAAAPVEAAAGQVDLFCPEYAPPERHPAADPGSPHDPSPSRAQEAQPQEQDERSINGYGAGKTAVQLCMDYGGFLGGSSTK